ncbi:MAG TPA: glycosyltransferase family 9 protein, partial [Gemmatimonadaceae bacterium]|nr:glycosyltransferase family 9 protein [Gemmatimonadaceae bacterium]
FASALVAPLRARYPGVELGVWCKAYAADVAALIPTVGEVIAADPFWDRAPGHGKGRLVPFLQSVKRVRRARYDVAILAAAPWRTAAAVALAGIPARIGLERHRNPRFLTHVMAPEDKQRPVLVEMARLLGPLGISATGLRYTLDRAPIAARIARMQAQLARPSAALHPFASKRARCVPVPEWITMARALDERGFEPIWIGTDAELQEVRTASGDRAWRTVRDLGDGSLADTAALLAASAVFAGHDSGPLHVAGAFGVPVLGVFAPGEPKRTFPQGTGPSRMIARPSPAGITAQEMLAELLALTAAGRAG